MGSRCGSCVRARGPVGSFLCALGLLLFFVPPVDGVRVLAFFFPLSEGRKKKTRPTRRAARRRAPALARVCLPAPRPVARSPPLPLLLSLFLPLPLSFLVFLLFFPPPPVTAWPALRPFVWHTIPAKAGCLRNGSVGARLPSIGACARRDNVQRHREARPRWGKKKATQEKARQEKKRGYAGNRKAHGRHTGIRKNKRGLGPPRRRPICSFSFPVISFFFWLGRACAWAPGRSGSQRTRR